MPTGFKRQMPTFISKSVVRKIYYFTVTVVLSALFVYILFFTVAFRVNGIPRYSLSVLKTGLALFILVCETIWAKTPYRTFSLCLLSLVVIGFLMRMLHWPFATAVMAGALAANLIVLAINAFKNGVNRSAGLIVLTYPLARGMALLAGSFRASGDWATLELCTMGLVALFMWFQLSKIR